MNTNLNQDFKYILYIIFIFIFLILLNLIIEKYRVKRYLIKEEIDIYGKTLYYAMYDNEHINH